MWPLDVEDQMASARWRVTYSSPQQNDIALNLKMGASLWWQTADSWRYVGLLNNKADLAQECTTKRAECHSAVLLFEPYEQKLHCIKIQEKNVTLLEFSSYLSLPLLPGHF